MLMVFIFDEKNVYDALRFRDKKSKYYPQANQ